MHSPDSTTPCSKDHAPFITQLKLYPNTYIPITTNTTAMSLGLEAFKLFFQKWA